MSEPPAKHGPGFPADPRETLPPRPASSIRRTSRLLTTWPNGVDGPLQVDGIARDVRVGSSADETDLLDETRIAVTFTADRAIEAIEVAPHVGDPDRLVGSGPGRGFRRAISAAFPQRQDQTTLAFFLVEDLTTTPLLSTFAVGQRASVEGHPPEPSSPPSSVIEGVCAGYRSGGLALQLLRKGHARNVNVALVDSYPIDDPTAAWHPVETPEGVAMCRRRRIDVTPRGQGFDIDAGFRDHSWNPDGKEAIVHEYELNARLEPRAGQGLTLTAVEARPRVIPYPDCPAAATQVGRLVGLTVADLRDRVLDELRGVDSCTHLNDMVRALAELPELIGETVTA